MLTDTVIRSAKCTEGPKELGDRGGLHLLLSPNGGKYWRFQYRFEGTQKTLALGVSRRVSRQGTREAPGCKADAGGRCRSHGRETAATADLRRRGEGMARALV